MRSLFVKELAAFFGSFVAYVVLGVFLVLSALVVWVFPDTNVLDYGFADLYSFFSFAPYLFLLLAPAITMRQWAEERRSGTLELLLSRPISLELVILGKFFASWAILILALVPTLLFCFGISSLGSPPGNLDWGATFGSYIGLVSLGGAFIAIGLFASALNQNQIISFLVAATLSFVLFEGLSSLAQLSIDSTLADWLGQVSMVTHFASLSRGLIVSGDLLYFALVALVFLVGSGLSIRAARW